MQLAILKEQDKANTYTPHGNVSKADCVIGFSFGYIGEDRYEKPGISNKQLASFIEEHFAKIPLILQFEIDDALKTAVSAHVIRKPRQKGAYLDSHEVAEQAFNFMKEQGWRTAIIVTHPAMEARNDALCIKMGIATITPPGLKVVEYDSDSAQPWTRDKASWWQREQESIKTCLENGWL